MRIAVDGRRAAPRARLLDIIEQRWLTGRTGAAWPAATAASLERDGADRPEALRLMTQRCIELMHTHQPVHAWLKPWPSGVAVGAVRVRPRDGA
jgi:hypothetical protein